MDCKVRMEAFLILFDLIQLPLEAVDCKVNLILGTCVPKELALVGL